MSRVDADVRYSIVPEWVLDYEQAGLSANAVRLYAVLARYGNSEGGSAFPGRKTLAGRMGVRKLDTVDKAAKELVAAGALVFESGQATGTTNVYRLISARPVPQGVSRSTGHPAERGGGVSRSTGHDREKSTETSSPKGEDAGTGRRDDVWDSLVRWLGHEPQTRTERAGWNRVARELREAGATGETVTAAGRAYDAEWKGLERSPYALMKWWGRFLTEGDGSNVKQAVLSWARNVGVHLEATGLDEELVSWASRGADDATLREAREIATAPIERLAAGPST